MRTTIRSGFDSSLRFRIRQQLKGRYSPWTLNFQLRLELGMPLAHRTAPRTLQILKTQGNPLHCGLCISEEMEDYVYADLRLPTYSIGPTLMREPRGFGGWAMEGNSGTGNARLHLYSTDIEAGIIFPEMEVVFRDTATCTTASVKEAQPAPQSADRKEEQIFHPVMEKVFGDKSHWATLTDLEVVRKMTQSRGKSKPKSKCGDNLMTKRDLLETMYRWWNSIDSIDCKPKRWMILVLWFTVVAVFFMMILACCIIVFVFTSIILWGPMVAIIFFWLLPYCEQFQAEYPAYVAGLLTVCSAAISGFLFLVVMTDDTSVYKQAVPGSWGALCEMTGSSVGCVAAQHLVGYALFQVAHVCLFIVICLICYGLSNLWSSFCRNVVGFTHRLP